MLLKEKIAAFMEHNFVSRTQNIPVFMMHFSELFEHFRDIQKNTQQRLSPVSTCRT